MLSSRRPASPTPCPTRSTGTGRTIRTGSALYRHRTGKPRRASIPCRMSRDADNFARLAIGLKAVPPPPLDPPHRSDPLTPG